MSIFFGLFSGKQPDTIGVKEGRLAPCPDTPNCVCSQNPESLPGAIMPLPYLGSNSNTIKRVITYVERDTHLHLVTQTENYLHIECESAFFGFIDDLELFCDQENHVTHVRSASRLGYSDLGVNRKRVEQLRDWLQLAAIPSK